MTTTECSEPALLGGTKAVTLDEPKWPVAGDREAAWLAEIALNGPWAWMGPHERAFCDEFARFIGTTHCACLCNGTVTLQCALQAVGVVPGDEVIVPALTWVATAQAALDVGANVVLVDIDPETLCISPDAIRAAITPKTKAIIPVHLYSCMCDMDAVMEIARGHDLRVVEDVAHQHGSRWRDTNAGSIGDAGSFSFQQSKVLTSGEGGAVTTSDPAVYDIVFCLKQVGWMPDLKTRGNRYGHNYRITEMQAALLRGGLLRLDDENRRREEAMELVREQLAAMGGPLRMPAGDPRVTRQVCYSLTMHYDAEAFDGLPRDVYMRALRAEGLPVNLTYEPVYRAALLNLYDDTSPVPFRDPGAMQDYRSLRLPNTERAVTETAMTLLHHNLLGGPHYIEQLLKAIRKVNDGRAGICEWWRRKQECAEGG
jgi:L-glutamine:2-deoxy-scyllo-inosose/3-amino-2,3-dideoxy-scyllo-inosose aminotransferase